MPLARSLGFMAVVALGASALLSSCSPAPELSPSMAVTPAAAVDAAVSFSVRGLAPWAEVSVHAAATDAEGVTWRSSAVFRASSAGLVRSDDDSSRGSYTGSDPMGLFTQMTHSGAPDDAAFALGGRSYSVYLSADVHGRTVASASTRRIAPLDAGVTKQVLTLQRDGLEGELFLPAHLDVAKPAVLLLGGSAGGLSQGFGAETLAADGYPTLTVAYFHAPGLPATLSRIPIEYFSRAGRLLTTRARSLPGHVIVWGLSRGSEAAVLAAAHYPSIFDGVIAGVPNDRVGAAEDGDGAAWTLHGRQIPFSTSSADDPDPRHDPATFLPVTGVRGPLMTICGGQDQVWNSCQHARALISARTSSSHHEQDVSVSYPRAGHLVGGADRYYSALTSSGTTSDGTILVTGGTRHDNAVAAAAARTRVLDFLDTTRTTSDPASTPAPR